MGVTYSFLVGICQPPSIQVTEELPTAVFNSARSPKRISESTLLSNALSVIGTLNFAKIGIVISQTSIIAFGDIFDCMTILTPHFCYLLHSII
jgi:hypothetical protein